jgi:hypothetical protein
LPHLLIHTDAAIYYKNKYVSSQVRKSIHMQTFTRQHTKDQWTLKTILFCRHRTQRVPKLTSFPLCTQLRVKHTETLTYSAPLQSHPHMTSRSAPRLWYSQQLQQLLLPLLIQQEQEHGQCRPSIHITHMLSFNTSCNSVSQGDYRQTNIQIL